MALPVDELVEALSVIEPARDSFAHITPDDIPSLQELYERAEPWMAARVVFVIARFADRKDARDVILGAVRDSRPEARAVAAAVAKDLPSEVSDRVLLPLLGDENVGVRRSAVLAVRAENGAPVREKLAGMGATEPADLLRREIASKLKGIR